MDTLNYIWLSNKKYYNPAKFESKSPIPVEYLNNAIKTALQNQNVNVFVWIDSKKIRGQDASFLNQVAVPENLSFRDLNTVDVYRNDPFFQNRATNIWQKCDLLRLSVVDHVLTNKTVETAFYSDFDVYIPKISSKVIQGRLNKTGLIFCYVRHFFENGFFGIRRDKKKLLEDMFIPYTKTGYGDGYKNGWTAFRLSAGIACDCGEGIFINVNKIRKVAIELATLYGGSSVKGAVAFDQTRQLLGVDGWAAAAKEVALASKKSEVIALPAEIIGMKPSAAALSALGKM